jgi:hypothetical protein
MTNVMHKFLIYLSIYFCLACFGVSFTPSSEAGVQIRQWFKFSGYGVSARTLTPYPESQPPNQMELKKEQSYNSISPLGLRCLFYGEFYLYLFHPEVVRSGGMVPNILDLNLNV